jgi:hypothetical protein
MVNEPSMNPNEQRQTFDALIRQHLPLRPAKLRMLMELRESIAEARKERRILRSHPQLPLQNGGHRFR